MCRPSSQQQGEVNPTPSHLQNSKHMCVKVIARRRNKERSLTVAVQFDRKSEGTTEEFLARLKDRWLSRGRILFCFTSTTHRSPQNIDFRDVGPAENLEPFGRGSGERGACGCKGPGTRPPEARPSNLSEASASGTAQRSRTRSN